MDNFNLMLEELYKLKNIFIICFAILLLSIILIFFFTFLYRKVLKKENKVLKNMIKQLYANIVVSTKLKKELNSSFKRPRIHSGEKYEIFGDSDQLEYNIFNFYFINEKLIFCVEPKNFNSMEFFKNKENHELIKMYISNKYKDYQFSDFTLRERVLYTLDAFKF